MRGIEWLRTKLLLPEGSLDVIARLTGLLAFLTALEIYSRFSWLRSEYRVPSWWFKTWCFDPPCNETAALVLVSTVAAGGLTMLAGYKSKVPPFIVALSMFYVTSLDTNIAFPHSYFLTIWVCVALLFRHSPVSVSRRLIQLGIVSCYGLSALQKAVSPEFICGHSMSAVVCREALRDWFFPIIKSCNLSGEVWRATAIAVVLVEAFFAVGLCFKQTRKAALWGIFLFQMAIWIAMPSYIFLLHFTIFICCLAFFDNLSLGSFLFWRKKKQKTPLEPSVQLPQPDLQSSSKDKGSCPSSQDSFVSPGRLYYALAAFAFACFLSYPLRMYFIPHAFERYTTMDRRPWTFCMYICREADYSSKISIHLKSGNWVPISPRGRMNHLSGNTDLYALARYLERSAPPFDVLVIESQYKTNWIWRDRKILTSVETKPGKYRYQLAWSREPLQARY